MSTPKPSASGSGNGSTPAPSQLRTTDIANAGFAAPASTGAQASKAPQPDFLVVLLDINPFAWADAAEDSSDARSGEMQGAAGALKKALDAVLVLMNAHVAMQHENGLAVYAAGLGSA